MKWRCPVRWMSLRLHPKTGLHFFLLSRRQTSVEYKLSIERRLQIVCISIVFLRFLCCCCCCCFFSSLSSNSIHACCDGNSCPKWCQPSECALIIYRLAKQASSVFKKGVLVPARKQTTHTHINLHWELFHSSIRPPKACFQSPLIPALIFARQDGRIVEQEGAILAPKSTSLFFGLLSTFFRSLSVKRVPQKTRVFCLHTCPGRHAAHLLRWRLFYSHN